MSAAPWLGLLLGMCISAQAQNTLKTIPQASQVQANADVQAYEALERSLELALSLQQTQDVMAMVSPKLVARDANQAGVMSRQAWLDQARKRQSTRLVSDLHVQLSPGSETAVVSFYLLEAQGNKRSPRTEFVVDIWQQRQLVSRYTSTVNQIPNARRPDGKE